MDGYNPANDQQAPQWRVNPPSPPPQGPQMTQSSSSQSASLTAPQTQAPFPTHQQDPFESPSSPQSYDRRALYSDDELPRSAYTTGRERNDSNLTRSSAGRERKDSSMTRSSTLPPGSMNRPYGAPSSQVYGTVRAPQPTHAPSLMQRSRSMVDFLLPMEPEHHETKLHSWANLTVGERLQPTLEHAQFERDKYTVQAKRAGLALNLAIGLSALLGTLITGLAAITTGRQTSIMTSILGGMSTIVASYLARARGSNEPEFSRTRARDLEQFVREMESFQLDNGYVVGDKYNKELETFRKRFEELLAGNALGNGPGNVGTGNPMTMPASANPFANSANAANMKASYSNTTTNTIASNPEASHSTQTLSPYISKGPDSAPVAVVCNDPSHRISRAV